MEELRTVELSSFDNTWYEPGAGKIKRLLWFFINAIFLINPLNPFVYFKIWLLKAFGAKVGNGVIIKPSVNIKYPWNLTIGHNVWIGENVWIDNLAQVTIHDNVTISQGAMLLTGSHNYKKSTFDLIVGRIILEEGVWIGAKAVVCPNVICKTHSILAVCSIANSNLEPFTIYQGNPSQAKRKRFIED